MAGWIRAIDRDVLVKKDEQEKDIAVKSGQMQHIVSLNVGKERVGAVL